MMPAGRWRGGRFSPRDAEVGVEWCFVKVPCTRRNVAKHDARIEHVVVQGKIANGNEVQIGLMYPVFFAQSCCGALQGVRVTFTAPVFLKCKLQFPLRADAREA